jgi:hypothetical protein
MRVKELKVVILSLCAVAVLEGIVLVLVSKSYERCVDYSFLNEWCVRSCINMGFSNRTMLYANEPNIFVCACITSPPGSMEVSYVSVSHINFK